MRIFLAGRVRIETAERTIEEGQLGGRQARLLFTYLVVPEGRAVPRDELAAALWGDTPPVTWEKALTILVSKLRGLLAEAGVDGAQALSAAFGCYRLVLPDGSWVDVVAARQSAHEADAAVAGGDLERARAAALITESLTREDFLPGEDGEWAVRRRGELAQVRASALALLATVCLRLGEHADATEWARQAIALEPFRESGYRVLMRAHIGTGNRAEALRVYDVCRRLLAGELGTDPSPETESVYRELLDTHRTVAPRPKVAGPTVARRNGAPRRPRRPARRRVLPTALAAMLGVSVITASTAGIATRTTAPIAANSIVALTDDGVVTDAITVGTRPVALSSAGDDLWVANLDDQSVTRVDLTTHRVLQHVGIAATPTALTATASAVWVTDNLGRISKIDPAYNRIASRSRSAPPSVYRRSTSPVLTAFGALWVVDANGYLLQIDADSGRRIGSPVDIGNTPSAITSGEGSLWITNRTDGTVARIDPTTLVVQWMSVGRGPIGAAVNGAGIWVANSSDHNVVRVDPETGTITHRTKLNGAPTAVLATPTALWVTDGPDVLRLDPRTGEVTKEITLGGTPDALAYAAGRVWVAVAASAPSPAGEGGIARFSVEQDFNSLDPALPTVYGIGYATCANLVTYPDVPGPDGSTIVPEVATTVPVPTDGGLTYTFTIAPGFGFSPPSKEAVTAATFKATIERVVAPKLRSPIATVFSGIVGYHAYVTGAARGIRGIVARENTLTITLSRPDGAFLADLAGGAACAVPRDTPVVPRGLDKIPSAGPYYIASYASQQQLVLDRNPNYRGARPHQLDEIIVTIGVQSSRAIEDIKAERFDYALDMEPKNAGSALAARYGPTSDAARAGHQQYFVSPADGARYLYMNTSRPPFSDVRLRRAVNFAIDRAALVEEGRQFVISNPYGAGEPTGDYLPPMIHGAIDAHLYPVDGPDLRRAREIAGHVHTTAVMWTPNTPPWIGEANLVQRDLAPLGIDVEVRKFPFNEYYAKVGEPGAPYDLAINSWALLNSDLGSILTGLFDSTVDNTDAHNLAYLNDPDLDARLQAAAQLSGPARLRAFAAVQLHLERDIVPVASFATTVSHDFFSARIGCQVYQPIMGIDLAALCLR